MQSKSLVPLRFFDCVRDRLTSLNPFNRGKRHLRYDLLNYRLTSLREGAEKRSHSTARLPSSEVRSLKRLCFATFNERDPACHDA